MNNLNKILMEIMDVYQSDLGNDEKYNKVCDLQTRYYKISFDLGASLDFAYQIYLMCENECYKIQQKPVMKKIDVRKVKEAISHLSEVLEKQEIGIRDGISKEEAICLLDWSVYNVRSTLQRLGINIQNNSLNGFCEIGQALSIMPFEHLGVKVTKNKAKDAFGYCFNHVFGTVTLPIKDGEMIHDEVYLLDTTYRQFFSSVRCNKGRYYAVEENTGLIANPDPGYFVYNEEFAKDLLANGYIILNEKNAYLYGECFYLSSLDIDNAKVRDDRKFDYYQAILQSSSDYVVNYADIDGFDVNFPDYNEKKRNHKC